MSASELNQQVQMNTTKPQGSNYQALQRLTRLAVFVVLILLSFNACEKPREPVIQQWIDVPGLYRYTRTDTFSDYVRVEKSNRFSFSDRSTALGDFEAAFDGWVRQEMQAFHVERLFRSIEFISDSLVLMGESALDTSAAPVEAKYTMAKDKVTILAAVSPGDTVMAEYFRNILRKSISDCFRLILISRNKRYDHPRLLGVKCESWDYFDDILRIIAEEKIPRGEYITVINVSGRYARQ